MLKPHLHTLTDLIAAHPDRTLAELKDALATPASVPTVWRAVRALGLTVKKKRSARPNTIGLTSRQRGSRGEGVHDHAPCGRWQTSTFLAALRVTGLTAPGVFDGAIDGESFRAYIEQILVPTLQPGDIVIADNGVVARIVTAPHDATRKDPHLQIRDDTGRPRAASLPCPAGLRAQRPSPMMDVSRKNVFSTRF